MGNTFKGSLEDLRNSLETDAKKDLDLKIIECKKLQVKLDKLKAELVLRDHSIGQLQARCMALSKGSLCLFCGMKTSCDELAKWLIVNNSK